MPLADGADPHRNTGRGGRPPAAGRRRSRTVSPSRHVRVRGGSWTCSPGTSPAAEQPPPRLRAHPAAAPPPAARRCAFPRRRPSRRRCPRARRARRVCSLRGVTARIGPVSGPARPRACVPTAPLCEALHLVPSSVAGRQGHCRRAAGSDRSHAAVRTPARLPRVQSSACPRLRFRGTVTDRGSAAYARGTGVGSMDKTRLSSVKFVARTLARPPATACGHRLRTRSRHQS